MKRGETMSGATVDVLDVAQFGFAAIAAAALWLFIKELIPRLLDIIKQNSEAMERVANVVETVSQQQQRNVSVMSDVASRLSVLEEHQKYGVRECPFLKERQRDAREDRGDK